jgi:hypothetical protein
VLVQALQVRDDGLANISERFLPGVSWVMQPRRAGTSATKNPSSSCSISTRYLKGNSEPVCAASRSRGVRRIVIRAPSTNSLRHRSGVYSWFRSPNEGGHPGIEQELFIRVPGRAGEHEEEHERQVDVAAKHTVLLPMLKLNMPAPMRGRTRGSATSGFRPNFSPVRCSLRGTAGSMYGV